MRCQNCGRELKNGARFCIGCGAQHDENGQLVSSNNPQVDYNKTSMYGSTGFKQYQPEENEQNFQQYNERQNNYDMNNNYTAPPKKKISPVMIICPIVIIGALAYTFLGGKKNKDVKETISGTQTMAVATASIATSSEVDEEYHEDGWSEDGIYYKNNKILKNSWTDDDFYVGSDGKKMTNSWTGDHYYVDEKGKKVTEQWIKFEYTSDAKDKKSKDKKIGYYYVGKNGKRVVDREIYGKYIDEEGIYWADEDEIMPNSEEEMDENVKETEMEKKTEKNIVKETTIPKETVATTVPTTKAVVAETQANIIAPTEKNVSAVASDGKSISYQISTEKFPYENITKYVSVIVDDQKYPNLIAGVNDWNTNRDRSGIASGESVLNENITVTYDVSVERNDNKIFSVYETKTKLDNNKAYEKVKRGYTWDANSGQQLSLDAIFNGDEKYSEFAKKALNKIKSNKNSFEEDIYEEIINGDPEDLLDGCDWYMTNAGLVIVFNSEFTGSEKVEPLTATFTYSESGSNVNKLLLTKYRKS